MTIDHSSNRYSCTKSTPYYIYQSINQWLTYDHCRNIYSSNKSNQSINQCLTYDHCRNRYSCNKSNPYWSSNYSSQLPHQFLFPEQKLTYFHLLKYYESILKGHINFFYLTQSYNLFIMHVNMFTYAERNCD